MDSQRNLFLIVFLLLFIVIWQIWQTDHNMQLFESQKLKNDNTENLSNRSPNTNIVIKNKNQDIFVKTDLFALNINTNGGDIYQSELLNFPEKLDSNKHLKLLKTNPLFLYQVQTGLIGPDGTDNLDKNVRPIFVAKKNHFEMLKGQNELQVPMVFVSKKGIIYTKTFIFKRGEYIVNVRYKINNVTRKFIKLSMFSQLQQTAKSIKDNNLSNNFTLHTYRGAAYSTDNIKYHKYKFNNILEDKNLSMETKRGWVAMIQQYFATAWIVNNKDISTIYTNSIDNNIAVIGYQSSPMIIPAGTEKCISSTLWMGPELQDEMAVLAPNLNLTVDYGWLWFISRPLFKLLKFIHSSVNNWGFSIIIITFIVRGIMYPLTKAQYLSMAKMRKLQPKIKKIQENLKDDKQKMSQEMMALYKEEKVNPLGGCLPLLIQMPIFLALYYMLSNSVELRHAPFIFWIRDLSSQDPYYILPILMGITMFFIQKMSPVNVTDPIQQKFMIYMPMIFSMFFLWFPSGLVIYYIISNLVTIMQQQVIFRSLKEYGF
ncbi:membrane protein insertase YidC [Candidatus Pantoea edessiphila]|uniref:Membrane protein insertase YidC n=1 Tax=Candidatus Pantoea edessiphila TaxID=2044610 RepID=A0A2P5T1C0_9GAMM|nr:membrane protein insertase YidC [Candidatus Pantoea edessiphila]PPI88353.1 membrane protein insertase YidC [Candidatus Pantoea edessiphila]